MTDPKRLMSDQKQPHGRRFGRTLDPLDYREGYPHNGVELVGAFGLDNKHDQLAAAKAAVQAPTSNASIRRPSQGAGNAPAVNQNGTNAAPPVKAGLFSVDGLKNAAPYMAITAVIIVVVAHFAFGKG